MERAIIHVNVADFAVAVERLVDPRLRGRPVVVAVPRAARAAVHDMSEEAYQAGVRKGMPVSRAARACRDVLVVAPHAGLYGRAMDAMLRAALPFSPRIESGESDGHLFVDATGTGRLWGPAVDVAWRLSRRIQKDVGLLPAWSVAPNKLVAKVATRLVKPRGEYVVGGGEEAAFLAPVPVGLVPGIEDPDLWLMDRLGLALAGDVAAWTLDQLSVAFGVRAGFLRDAARGRDLSPVLPEGEKPPEVRREHVFADDTNEVRPMEAALYGLCEAAGACLRAGRRAAGQVRVEVFYSDGLSRARSLCADRPTADDISLFDLSRRALAGAWARRVRVRRLCLACGRLAFPPAQMELFPDPRLSRRARLTAVLDQVRSRFGRDALCTGRALAA